MPKILHNSGAKRSARGLASINGNLRIAMIILKGTSWHLVVE
jgi:hypothetical protein